MKNPPKPETQAQEVLYGLITRINIDRRMMMLEYGVLNLTAIISDLRYKGVEIKSNPFTVKNKFNRDVTFVRYSLTDKKRLWKYIQECKTNRKG